MGAGRPDVVEGALVLGEFPFAEEAEGAEVEGEDWGDVGG